MISLKDAAARFGVYPGPALKRLGTKIGGRWMIAEENLVGFQPNPNGRQPMRAPGMVSIADLAARACCSCGSIAHLIARGHFPGAVKIGGSWAIPEAEAAAFQPRRVGRQRRLA